MKLFLFLLLPIALIIFFLWKKEAKFLLPAAIGFLTSIIIFVFKIMFTYSHRLVPYSFGQNLWHYISTLSLLPVLILFLVYCLLTKDSWEFKIKAFLPLTLSYMMVYLPYYILSASAPSVLFFHLFILPILILGMLIGISCSLQYLYDFVINKNILFSIIHSLFTIFFAILPAVILSLYDIDFSLVLIIILTLLNIVMPFLFQARRIKLEK